MQMSQELFERFVGSHDSDRVAPSAVLPVGCRRAPERRVAVRMQFGKRAQIRRDRGKAAGKWETVMVRDVSQSGLGLLSDDAMSNGETFVVRLPQRDGTLCRIRCAAKRCEAGGFGGVAFLVGATFEQIIEQPSIRLNDDDQHPTQWDEEVSSGFEAAGTPSRSAGLRDKPVRTGLVRAAVNLLKAVGPIRHAAHWGRRHDDFSSN
jgi:hypothetical protein